MLGKIKLPVQRTVRGQDVHQIEAPSLFEDGQPDVDAAPTEHVPSIQPSEDTFQQVEALAAQLKATIAEAAQKKYIRQEFTTALQKVLKKYIF